MYKYKSHQLINFAYPETTNTQQIYVNSEIPVDKIRISISSIDLSFVLRTSFGLLAWSDLVNKHIGTLAYTVQQGVTIGGAAGVTQETLEPYNGIEYFFPSKVQLVGNYNVNFTDFAGNVPVNTGFSNPEVNLLIEYYIH